MKVNVTNTIMGEVTIRIREDEWRKLPSEVRDELVLYTLGTGPERDMRYFTVRH